MRLDYPCSSPLNVVGLGYGFSISVFAAGSGRASPPSSFSDSYGSLGGEMSELATYSALERLKDGREVQIRALRAEDKQDFLSAVAKTSAKTLYRRFFGAKREFSEKEIAFFLDTCRFQAGRAGG